MDHDEIAPAEAAAMISMCKARNNDTGQDTQKTIVVNEASFEFTVVPKKKGLLPSVVAGPNTSVPYPGRQTTGKYLELTNKQNRIVV